MGHQSEQVEELLKEGRAADKLDKERAETFAGLLKNPGWVLLSDLLNTRIQALGEAIVEPGGSVDGMVALEYIKGTMRGLILARDLPQLTIQAMKAATPSGDET